MRNWKIIAEIANNLSVPNRINLFTNDNKCETVLDLIELNPDKQETEFIYYIGASRQYFTNEHNNKIEFTGGPIIRVNDNLKGMIVKRINQQNIICIKR